MVETTFLIPSMTPRAAEPTTLPLLDHDQGTVAERDYLRLVVLGWGEYVGALERRDGDDPNERAWAELGHAASVEAGTG